ncbi:MAG: nuclear transport factor 2 family protein [Planctomycetota bacterium]
MQPQTTNQTDHAAALDVLEAYYDGLYQLDIAKLREVFSPSARYATIANGSLLELSIDEYYARLAQRTAPRDEGVPYGYRVISLRFAGENTALAELECSFFGHDYTDFLSLLRIDGRWRIQSKVFEGVPHNVKEAS